MSTGSTQSFFSICSRRLSAEIVSEKIYEHDRRGADQGQRADDLVEQPLHHDVPVGDRLVRCMSFARSIITTRRHVFELSPGHACSVREEPFTSVLLPDRVVLLPA